MITSSNKIGIIPRLGYHVCSDITNCNENRASLIYSFKNFIGYNLQKCMNYSGVTLKKFSSVTESAPT